MYHQTARWNCSGSGCPPGCSGWPLNGSSWPPGCSGWPLNGSGCPPGNSACPPGGSRFPAGAAPLPAGSKRFPHIHGDLAGSIHCRCHPCRDPPDMPAVPPRPPVHWVPGFCLSYLNQGHCLPLTGWYYHVRNPCIVPFLMPVQSGPIIREEYIITYKKIQSAGNLSRRITAYTPHIIRLV